MILPGQGWEVTDRIVATTTLAARLAFICLDSLIGISRWFRTGTTQGVGGFFKTSLRRDLGLNAFASVCQRYKKSH